MVEPRKPTGQIPGSRFAHLLTQSLSGCRLFRGSVNLLDSPEPFMQLPRMQVGVVVSGMEPEPGTSKLPTARGGDEMGEPSAVSIQCRQALLRRGFWRHHGLYLKNDPGKLGKS